MINSAYSIRTRALAAIAAAVVAIGLIAWVTERTARPAPFHYLGLKGLELAASSGTLSMYLRIPPITPAKPGGNHSTDLKLTSFDWELHTQDNIGSQSTGAGAGTPEVLEFKFTRPIDVASPKLLQTEADGNELQGTTIYLLNTDSKGTIEEYVSYVLTDAAIEDVADSASGGTEKETIQLDVGGVKISYYQGTTLKSTATIDADSATAG